MRLRPLATRLGVPVLVINDSPIKQFAENRHAVGQSVLESYLRMTNQMTNGRQVAVFGYGACGKGVAANFRNAYASVAVVDVDRWQRLEAHLDGFAVPDRDEALRGADVVVTVTGAESVLTEADLELFKDGAVLLNAAISPGRSPWTASPLAEGDRVSRGGRRDHDVPPRRRAAPPSPRPRPYGQPGGTPPAR